jgi:hypothetical protein
MLQGLWHESMAGNGMHGAQHAGIRDIPGTKLAGDHLLPLPIEIRFRLGSGRVYGLKHGDRQQYCQSAIHHFN